MIAQEKGQILAEFFANVLNGHDVMVSEDFLAPDFLHHTPAAGMGSDLMGYKQELTLRFIAYHDLQYIVEESIVQGNKVIVHWTAVATHPGGLIGKRGIHIPIGRKLRWSGMTMARLRDGRIEELWTYQDEISLLGQMKEIPLMMVEN